MVVLFNLSIKTIRGEEFTIQTDRDADTLGLKVQIWELRNVAVENQRLVFAGRELQDAVKLADAGVGDGATIFMVEAAGQDVAPPAFAQPAPQNPVVSNVPLIQQDSERVVVNLPPAVQPVNVDGRRVVGYQPLAPEILSQERMDATYDLARWIRKYALFSALLLVVGGAMCPHGGWSLLPLLLTLIGWMGTRNLCRCNLGVYAAFIFFAAISMIGHGIFAIRWAVHAHKRWAWALSLVVFVGILHLCIFACIIKLMKNIARLVGDEKKQVRTRIAEHRTLC